MSSLDDKPRLSRALPLDRDSTATQASKEGTSSLRPDKSTSNPSYQEAPSTRPDDDIGLPLESVPSIVNKNPKTPVPRPERRDGRFSLSDTVVANTIRREMLTDPDATYDSRTRMSGASSHYPAYLSDTGSTRHRGDSHSTQRTRSKSPLFPTGHAGSGQSGVSQQSVYKKDGEEPADVTPKVFGKFFKGEMSGNDKSRIGRKYLRALFGGDA
jgi:hypothetical protein